MLFCSLTPRCVVILALVMITIAYIIHSLQHIACDKDMLHEEIPCMQSLAVHFIYYPMLYMRLIIPYYLFQWGLSEPPFSIDSYRASKNKTVTFNRLLHLPVTTLSTSINDVPVYIYTLTDKTRIFDETSALIYVHGGGAVIRHTEDYDSMLRWIAYKSGIKIMSIEYRKSPEVLYPQPQEDCLSVIYYVFKHSEDFGLNKSKISIGGDSFGGHTSLYVAYKWKEFGYDISIAPIKSLILIYPWCQWFNFELESFSYSQTRPLFYFDSRINYIYISYHLIGTLDLIPYLANSSLAKISNNYDLYRRKYPDIVPDITWDPPQYVINKYSKYVDNALSSYGSPLLREDFSAIPQTFLMTAENDILLNENLILYKRMTDAGVKVEYKLMDKMFHGFISMPFIPNVLTPNEIAIDVISKYLRKIISEI